MLIKFEIENYRTFKNVSINTISEDNNINLIAGFFGANNSGKTNFYKGIREIYHSMWGIFYSPKPFDIVENKDSVFKIYLYIDNNEYEYTVKRGSVIKEESLFLYKETSKELIIKKELKGDCYEYTSELYEITESQKRYSIYNYSSYAQTFFRANLDVNSNTHIEKVYDYLQNKMSFISCYDFQEESFKIDELKKFSEFIKDKKLKDKFLKILSCFGIDFINIRTKLRDKNYYIVVTKKVNNKLEIKILNESRGTMNLINTLIFIFNRLEQKFTNTIFIDDFGLGLHPTVSSHILKIFKNEEVNKYKSQLIFFTQEVKLLDKKLLDTSQMYLMNNIKGKSILEKVNDYQDIEGSYRLDNLFMYGGIGGIPYVKELIV